MYNGKGIARYLAFQHTAARRRLGNGLYDMDGESLVSTHSRPKAAGEPLGWQPAWFAVSTHSRSKAAGSRLLRVGRMLRVSTHSRPKAAGFWHHQA